MSVPCIFEMAFSHVSSASKIVNDIFKPVQQSFVLPCFICFFYNICEIRIIYFKCKGHKNKHRLGHPLARADATRPISLNLQCKQIKTITV